MGYLMILSVIIKAFGSILEMINQLILTRSIGISEYGDYSFYISIIDLLFWLLFSGIAKCNTFYLSDKKSTIKTFKKKYYLYYVAPVMFILLIMSMLNTNKILMLIVIIILLQTVVQDKSSSLMATGNYSFSLLGEYLIGRLFLLISVLVVNSFFQLNVGILILLYGIQYLIIMFYYKIKRKKISCSLVECTVDLNKLIQYQKSDIILSIISQMPLILQYVFVGAFETGFMGVIAVVRKLVNFISGPTAKIFLPKFSECYRKKDIDGLKKSYNTIVKTQMMFISCLSILLLCFPTLVLKIFSPELLIYENTFVLVSFIFLISASLGPIAGLMQMTGNEKRENNFKIISLIAMIIALILLRSNKMFALYAMMIQMCIENFLKYYYICKWFEKPPVPFRDYIFMWIPIVLIFILINILDLKNSMFALMLFSLIGIVLNSVIILVIDESARKFVYRFLKRKFNI